MNGKDRMHNNLAMLCDFYELTMGNGYFEAGMGDKITYFDTFFRRVPDGGGYAIFAGLEQVMEYLEQLRFDGDDIDFLRGKGIFGEGFLEYLRDLKFECDVYAMPEGTPVFPGEPLIIVKGPAIQAQLIETMVLLTVNHQSLIATKASRIVRAADGRAVMEFGSRRAHGVDGALLGARAAYIGGCVGSACTLAEQVYGVPALGTMAHSWVQMFDDEYDAFAEYARNYPDGVTLLVDTYNVLKSGVPNAIRVFDEVLAPMGKRPGGIRIDSGDITYLTKSARDMLDAAGYPDCKIVASNSLDEYIIRDTLMQGAAIDTFGVGERLITSRSEPVFGGVFKLVATEEDGEIIPKIKLSENVSKITTPHFKQVYRLYENGSRKAIADLVCLHDEVIDETKPLTIFHPDFTWKKKTIEDFEARPLLTQVIKNGKRCAKSPAITDIREYCREELGRLWDAVTRFENPHEYYVDLSESLWKCKQELIEKNNI